MLQVFKDERYLNARKEKRIEVFENINAPILTPEYLLSLESNSTQDFHNDGTTLTIHDGLSIIPELAPLKEYCVHVPVFMELEKEGKTLGRHRDGNEVLFIQSYGSTEWKIEDSIRGDQYTIILEQGDAVFFPSGFFHKVTTQTSPRVGLHCNVSL
jgi:hypothetical protein